MEGKNAQKQIYDIPINMFKNSIKSSKKKNEILDLFTNHNQLKSEAEFKDVEP